MAKTICLLGTHLHIVLDEKQPSLPVADPGPLMLWVLDRWTPTVNTLQTLVFATKFGQLLTKGDEFFKIVEGRCNYILQRLNYTLYSNSSVFQHKVQVGM